MEALYDVEADPHEVNNLAADPAYRQVLMDLRERLQVRMREMPDLSLYPESYLVQHALDHPTRFAAAHQAEMTQMLDTANLALIEYSTAKDKLQAAMQSDNPMIRYWAVMATTAFGEKAKDLTDDVAKLAADPSEIVQVRAAEFLGITGARNPQPLLTKIVNSTDDPVVATEALNSIVYFKDFYGDRYSVKRSDFSPQAKGADIDDRLNYINGVPYPPRAQKKKKSRKK